MRYTNNETKINILFHKSNSGREIIKDYIESLDAETNSSIISYINKFQNNPAYRQYPNCKKIQENIFEIRIKIKNCFRILYAYISVDYIVILHIFKKKTNKTPKKDLKLAIKRLKQYKKI